MPTIPRDPHLDATLALRRDPYRYVAERCRRFGTDLFRTRLFLQNTICMSGPEAAALFYDPQRFSRAGAAPEPIRATLFGKGGVQGLDGAAHRHRKAMFLAITPPERVQALAAETAASWAASAESWTSQPEVVLYDEVQRILTRAVCSWAGVPPHDADLTRRTRDLVALFDAAGAAGPRHLWSRLARKRSERWIADVIDQVRTGRLAPPPDGAAWIVARHRDLDGKPLSRRIAAVELLNVLRPTVAVSVWIVFAAHALHAHPECRDKLRANEPGYADLFVQEVRRFYPFFPAVVARVRDDFEWRGYRFPRKTRVLLDLYGTDHDPRTWDAPDEFRPERFRVRGTTPYDFIPQGGGDKAVNHRCPGEEIAVELTKVALDFLTNRLTYDVPDQDRRIDFTRLPALPRSRFRLRDVRHTPTAQPPTTAIAQAP